jgi:hypothetical protein
MTEQWFDPDRLACRPGSIEYPALWDRQVTGSPTSAALDAVGRRGNLAKRASPAWHHEIRTKPPESVSGERLSRDGILVRAGFRFESHRPAA